MGDSESGGTRYNLRSPSVKRLMQESKELREATEQYHAQPLDDNLYEWHFTIRGAPDTDFADGVYHGRIMLPAEYPMKPPSIVLLTPNGRFEVNKKICLSISGHHPESWQPSWSIRTALMAIIGFLPSPGKGAIGALDYPAEERKKLAKRSKEWKCPVCNVENHQLLRASASSSSSTEEKDELMQEFKDLARKISFKGESTSESSSGDSAAKELVTPTRKDSKELAEQQNVGAGDAGSRQDSAQGATAASTPQPDSPISPSKDSVFEVGAAATANTPPPAPLTAAFPRDESVASSSSDSTSINDSADVARNNDTDGLRRRTARLEDVAAREVAAREAAAAAAAPVTNTSTPTVVHQRAPAASASSSYYLMILVSVAIVVLLLRRILRLVDFKFDFQFDYQFERH